MKQTDAAPKRKPIRLLPIALLAVLIAAAILLGVPGLAARRGGEAAQAGDYVLAEAEYRSAAGHGLFNRLFHAEEKALALHPAACYQQGEAALAEGRFAEALAFFTEAGDYRDAAARIPEVQYLQGEKALEEGLYEEALEAFTAAGSYEDAAERIPEISLRAGQALLAEGRFRDAAATFLAAGDYEDAREQLFGCLAGAAREAVEAGEVARAEEYLALAEDAPNPKLRGEIHLYLTRGCTEAGDLAAALKHLGSVNYDTADQALLDYETQTRYLLGLACLDAREYDAAERQFLYLGEYEDAAHLLQSARLGKVRLLSEAQDWPRLIAEGEKLDPALLDAEERELWQNMLYDDAAGCDARDDLPSAFALYRLSGKGDFQARMDDCNERYIAAPRELRFFNEDSSRIEITRLTARYHAAHVTFELSYTIAEDLVIVSGTYVPRILLPGEELHSDYNNILEPGSSTLSFDLIYSWMSDPSYTVSIRLTPWTDEEEPPVSGADLSWQESIDLGSDLYGFPII